MASIKCGHCKQVHSSISSVFICAHIYGVLEVTETSKAKGHALEDRRIAAEVAEVEERATGGASATWDHNCEDFDGECDCPVGSDYDGPDDSDVDFDWRVQDRYDRSVYGD